MTEWLDHKTWSIYQEDDLLMLSTWGFDYSVRHCRKLRVDHPILVSQYFCVNFGSQNCLSIVVLAKSKSNREPRLEVTGVI